MTTITFLPPAPPINLNHRLHWAQKAKRTKYWREAAHWATVSADRDLLSPVSVRAIGPSIVRVTFPVTQNRRRDPHNWTPTVKAIIDGLTDAGCWPDDNSEWVAVLDSKFEKRADVLVELTPMPGRVA